jgi:hypothetical protein
MCTESLPVIDSRSCCPAFLCLQDQSHSRALRADFPDGCIPVAGKVPLLAIPFAGYSVAGQTARGMGREIDFAAFDSLRAMFKDCPDPGLSPGLRQGSG